MLFRSTPDQLVQCTPSKNLKAEVITGTVVSVDLVTRTISLRLPKDTIFSTAPMWGGVVIVGPGGDFQTTDDNLHVGLRVCTRAEGDPKALRVGQRIKVTRDRAESPGAIQSFEVTP